MGRLQTDSSTAEAPCVRCGARGWTVCSSLTHDELTIIEGIKLGHRDYSAGADFLRQGEPQREVFTLLQGWAMRYSLLDDGSRQIIDFCLPGAFIGFQPDSESPKGYAAQAITDIKVCALPQKGLMDMLSQTPNMAVRLACIAYRDQVSMARHLANVGRRVARGRVANLLMELFVRVRMRSAAAASESIPLPLTQELIGDALGLTSVHVNRTLRSLREDKIVSLQGGTLRILDPDRLAVEAGFEEGVDVPASFS